MSSACHTYGMSERRLQPVTRVRGELQPSPAVVRAVNRFLEKPMDERSARMYTTAQTVVTQGEHRTRHALELADIEREMRKRSLAQRAFVLAQPLGLQEHQDGSGRLFFNVASKNTRDLRWVGEQLNAIEGLEEPDENDLLYVEIAKGGLAHERRRRREQVMEGRDLIGAELRHPSAQYRMTAIGLHIVTRDMMYSVAEREGLPLAE